MKALQAWRVSEVWRPKSSLLRRGIKSRKDALTREDIEGLAQDKLGTNRVAKALHFYIKFRVPSDLALNNKQ